MIAVVVSSRSRPAFAFDPRRQAVLDVAWLLSRTVPKHSQQATQGGIQISEVTTRWKTKRTYSSKVTRLVEQIRNVAGETSFLRLRKIPPLPGAHRAHPRHLHDPSSLDQRQTHVCLHDKISLFPRDNLSRFLILPISFLSCRQANAQFGKARNKIREAFHI